MCQSRVSAHLPGRALAICSTSLSPRPDRHCEEKDLVIGFKSHIDRAITHHDDVGVFWQSLGDLNRSPDGVSGLQGGNDTLELSAQSECTKSLLVIGNNVLGSARVLQPSVLGSDSLSGVRK
jgi:hypothetical protein